MVLRFKCIFFILTFAPAMLMSQTADGVYNYFSNFYSLLNNLGDNLFDLEDKELFKESIVNTYFHTNKTLIFNNLSESGSEIFKGEEYLDFVILNNPDGISFDFELLRIGELKRNNRLRVDLRVAVSKANHKVRSDDLSIILDVNKISKDRIVSKLVSMYKTEKFMEEQETSWSEALSSNSPKAYQKYLNQYPKGKYSSVAIKAIEEHEKIMENAWSLAKSSKSIDRINLFISRYPDSKYIKEAKSLRNNSGPVKALSPILESVLATMIHVEGGSLIMGCKDGIKNCEQDEKPYEIVQVESFWLSQYEVTQKLYEEVMGHNPSYYNDGSSSAPVESISWKEAQKFIFKLNEISGGSHVFRLPTEREWEFAAGGGDAEAYSGGNDLFTLAIFRSNSEGGTGQVGSMSANSLGIYDMTGNVSEWCTDLYGPLSSDNRPIGNERVIRGGSWNDKPKDCRVNNRDTAHEDYTHETIGFRLAFNYQ